MPVQQDGGVSDASATEGGASPSGRTGSSKRLNSSALPWGLTRRRWSADRGRFEAITAWYCVGGTVTVPAAMPDTLTYSHEISNSNRKGLSAMVAGRLCRPGRPTDQHRRDGQVGQHQAGGFERYGGSLLRASAVQLAVKVALALCSAAMRVTTHKSSTPFNIRDRCAVFVLMSWRTSIIVLVLGPTSTKAANGTTRFVGAPWSRTTSSAWYRWTCAIASAHPHPQ